MERSAGDMNTIKEEMSEKTACMWEEYMPDNHYSVCNIFSITAKLNCRKLYQIDLSFVFAENYFEFLSFK